MVVEYFLSGGAVTTGSFIAYLIYQSSLDRKDREQERKTRIEEKNQFINILGEIKEELAELKIFHQHKK
mgnify:CR=1 FL=1